MRAYEELVRRYRDVAVCAAYVIAGASETEDAAREGFVKAYHAPDRFREGAPFRPWLLRIVTKEARNRARGTGRRARLALRAVDAASGSAASVPRGEAGPRMYHPGMSGAVVVGDPNGLGAAEGGFASIVQPEPEKTSEGPVPGPESSSTPAPILGVVAGLVGGGLGFGLGRRRR